MQLWTPEHIHTLLPAIAGMLVVAVVLRLTIGKKELKIRMIPFQILACALFLIEIGKQIVSFMNGYNLYHIPLHFCSMFIVALPLMAFYRGKHQKKLFEVVTVLAIAMTSLMLIYPNLIYGAGSVRKYFQDYLAFHAVTFHNIVLFALILVFALNLDEGKPVSVVKELVIVIGIFCIVSAVMAQILQTNFANFYECNIAPLEAIRVNIQGVLGYSLAQTIYVLILSAMNVAYVLMGYGIYRLLKKLIPSKASTTA